MSEKEVKKKNDNMRNDLYLKYHAEFDSSADDPIVREQVKEIIKEVEVEVIKEVESKELRDLYNTSLAKNAQLEDIIKLMKKLE